MAPPPPSVLPFWDKGAYPGSEKLNWGDLAEISSKLQGQTIEQTNKRRINQGKRGEGRAGHE